MQRIIDFHAHAFPDELAERAMKILAEEADIKAHLDGRLASLLSSMDRYGIEKSVVCSIATKPAQFDPIMAWSRKIRSERIIPFPSFHPADPAFAERIAMIKGEGFKGVKFHPYYQEFALDEERLYPIYERLVKENLIVVVHTGYDVAFARTRKADPERILKVTETFPGLRFVSTHLGAWEEWADVGKYLVGKKIYMEISFSLEYLKKEEARKIFLNHPAEYILFGTDSPWTEQGETLSLLKGLGLGEEREGLILRENAAKLLDSV
jgi:hypothetical protein